MMRKIARMFLLIDRISEGVGKGVSYVIIAIASLLLLELILRYVFNSPTIWIHDISQFLFGACFVLGAAYTLLQDAHVNMDMLYIQLGERKKAGLDIVTGLILLVFCSVLVWKTGYMAYESLKFREVFTQSAFEPPLYPIKIIFFLGCLLLLLQAISKLVVNLRRFFEKDISDRP